MTGCISNDEMTLWSRYIQQTCGIALDASKAYLLETRLGSLVTETGSLGFGDLLHRIQSDRSNGLRTRVVDAITTNETSFFRDSGPFELLQHKLIPELIDRRSKLPVRPIPIRIWSAACSTGQEVYSIAMLLKELLGNMTSYDVRIFGTDISNRVVAVASQGRFTQLEIDRGLPIDYVARYFVKDESYWKIRDEVRAMASFRTMNLLEPFSFPVPFDIILCRNVAIYFSEADKIRLFTNLGRCLSRDGSLIIGSTESLTGLCPQFEPKRYLRAVYYQVITPV